MKRKLATIGFSYLVGLICASFLPTDFLLIIAFSLLIISVILWLLRRRAFALGLFSGGVALGVWLIYFVLAVQPVEALYGTTLEATGVITEKSMPQNDLCSYVVDAEFGGIKAKIAFYGGDSNAERGDRISFTVKLSALKDNADFSESAYYKSKGIVAKGTLKSSVTIVEKGFDPFGFIRNYREFIRRKIKQALTGDEGSLICAMFLGDKSGLSLDVQNIIKRSGISHFTAVSGLHLTIAAHIIMTLFAATKFRKRNGIQFAVLLVTILWFMVFFNLSMSVIRSGIMLIIYYGAAPLHRKGDTLNSLGCAVLLVTLFSPYSCTDVGFLMSVLGTIGVGVVSPKVCALYKSKRFYKIRTAFTATICAMLCTLPVSVVFGGISVVSPVTNIVLLPLFTAVMVCLVLFTFSGGLLAPMLLFAGLSAKAMLWTINFFGSLKYAYFPLDYDFIVPFFLIAALFIFAAAMLLKSAEKTVKAALISVMALAAMMITSNYVNLNNTKITVYSDGNSGAVMVYGCKGSCVIATDSSAKTVAAVKEFMQNNFMDKLNVLVVQEDSYNNTGGWDKISCDCLVLPEEKGKYDISGEFTLTANGYSLLEFDGLRLSVSSIKESAPSAEISVIYGYKAKYNQSESPFTVYISKRMDEKTNAYYNSVSYMVKPDGSIREVIK